MKGLTIYLTTDQNFVQDINKHGNNNEKLANHIIKFQDLAQEGLPTDSSAPSLSKENLLRLINKAGESIKVVLLVTNDQGKPPVLHHFIKFTGNTNKHGNPNEDGMPVKLPGKSLKKRPKRYKLTETETEILKLICEEKTSEEIADSVCLGKRTIEHYRRRILIKTGSQSPIGLVKFAIKNGLYENL